MQARVRRVVMAIVMLAWPAAFAHGQGQAIDGIIEGIVRAAEGAAPMAGATVRAFNAGTGYERVVVSDAAGPHGMPLTPPG